ncbi:MAG: MFS transporter [Candidatus Helarchaeota archaeon]
MKRREAYTVVIFIFIASLDNAALALIPAILPSVAVGVNVSPAMAGIISFAVAVVTFVTALTSFFWGYWGDRYSRKKLLLYGTIIWVSFIFLTAFAQDFTQLFIFQLLAGVGLGCIASVGFSVIVDFVSPRRRGLILSLWGLSQGAGSFAGYFLAVYFNSLFGWNSSFIILSVITTGFIVAYFFTVEPERGATEDELQELFDQGNTYDYKISREDIRYILGVKTNRYLILQGLFAQVGWGGLQLLPTVFIYKLLAQGVPESPANVIGPIIAGMFQIGGIFSIIFGWLGDRYQQRTLKARPIISALGVLIGIPLVIGMLLIPFQLPSIPNTNDFGVLIGYVFGQLVTNPLFILTFICALGAAIFSSADSPNFFALVGDVNLPEHRGTMFGFANFVNGIGRTAGLVVLPSIQLSLVHVMPLEWSWIWGLIITLLFFLPTGLCYLMTIRTAPHDIQAVKKILAKRGELD